MGCYSKGAGYSTPREGTYFIDPEEDYAILVTNTQGPRNTILNPITINKVYGKMEFKTLIEQVFWLSRVNAYNIYTASRLPATTQWSNEISRT